MHKHEQEMVSHHWWSNYFQVTKDASDLLPEFVIEYRFYDLLYCNVPFKEVSEMERSIGDEELRTRIQVLVDVIAESTSDERLRIADEMHELYGRVESEGAKELVSDLENYARYGFIQIEVKKQKPTSGATEISD